MAIGRRIALQIQSTGDVRLVHRNVDGCCPGVSSTTAPDLPDTTTSQFEPIDSISRDLSRCPEPVITGVRRIVIGVYGRLLRTVTRLIHRYFSQRTPLAAWQDRYACLHRSTVSAVAVSSTCKCTHCLAMLALDLVAASKDLSSALQSHNAMKAPSFLDIPSGSFALSPHHRCPFSTCQTICLAGLCCCLMASQHRRTISALLSASTAISWPINWQGREQWPDCCDDRLWLDLQISLPVCHLTLPPDVPWVCNAMYGTRARTSKCTLTPSPFALSSSKCSTYPHVPRFSFM
ncbi:hypothetical protein CONLIGDRAFT_82358 [Coniochaeta ligniaria NRRL 30616]|uniref:Uncharacterized protein n=1 Tax=Coniochaeta ligniaria NRRL 30616 TaxID=1408157 RepID=A0A1J7J7J4_9PEZI|nr:hypothetical protein CONLIGDRAFT_82358 [Coniochaeta ligniaria NRRL 30616]